MKSMIQKIIDKVKENKLENEFINNYFHKNIPLLIDSYPLHYDTIGCSDHCPVVLIIQL